MRAPGTVRFTAPTEPSTAERMMAEFPAAPGLYLHVPFCTRICPFCPYNKVRYGTELVGPYFEALGRELDTYRGAARRPFRSLYVGGGTPTLCLDELAVVLAGCEVDGERAIEVLPNHLTDPTADRLVALGITHVSIGAQSFDADVLHHLRRPNSVAMNRNALEVAVGRFECVDVDLVFDVAYRSPEVLLADLRTCFEAGVDQVSSYPLMRFGYTPFGTARHDRRAEHRLLRAATEVAEAHGFERQSVWTFGRRGGPAYSSITRPWYLGVGAGAATFTSRTFAVNHFGLDQYVADLAQGALPVALVAELGPVQRAAYHLFWQCYTGRADLESFHQLFGRQRVLTAAIGAFERLGWVERRAGDIELTGAGYDRYHDLERWVTYHMIEPLWSALMHEHEAPTTAVPLEHTVPDRLVVPRWSRAQPTKCERPRRKNAAIEATGSATVARSRRASTAPNGAFQNDASPGRSSVHGPT